MLSGVDKLIRVGLLGVIALLVTNLLPSGIAMAQTAGPPPMKSFFGVIKFVPNNRSGLWTIGTETVEIDNYTDFYQFYGPLAVGTCVRVDMRRGRAQRIASVKNSTCVPLPAKDQVLD